MKRSSLVDWLADELVQAIIDGRYPPGATLPSEAELADESGVSRLTVREAIKVLRAKNVVRVQQGRGTYVNPPDRWTALEPLLRAEQAKGPERGIAPRRLIEARRLIESGVAELAARRRSESDLEVLAGALDDMVVAAESADVESFVAADLAFHQVLMDAAGNVFISALFDPLARLLLEARRQTSEHDAIRRHAIEQHRKVLEAVRAGDSERARRAMQDHMDQTERDLATYVLDQPPASEPATSEPQP